MKKCFWEIVNLVTGETTRYCANFGPVDENHVRTSPYVVRWAKGNPISVK